MIRKASPISVISFSDDHLSDVTPHEDDPIFLLVIMMGHNVHRFLIDQESSINVMFWDMFIGLQIAWDQLKPFN